MTLSEFKAWLEGFSASFIDGAPDAEQWAVIENKLNSISAVKIEPLAQVPQAFPPFGKPWLGEAPPKAWYSH